MNDETIPLEKYTTLDSVFLNVAVNFDATITSTMERKWDISPAIRSKPY